MVDFPAARDWGRAWPSRSRTQGAAFGGAKGKPEDEEMRSTTRVIRRGFVESTIEASIVAARVVNPG
jgi:hypothetical protein